MLNLSLEQSHFIETCNSWVQTIPYTTTKTVVKKMARGQTSERENARAAQFEGRMQVQRNSKGEARSTAVLKSCTCADETTGTQEKKLEPVSSTFRRGARAAYHDEYLRDFGPRIA